VTEVNTSFKIHVSVFLQIISTLPNDTHRERNWTWS